MSKKIIFVGPPAAGKTTLRKIFFEGENASKLLEYSLEPTYGKESVLLQLEEDVGVFDLSGQENERWLDSDERSVFSNAEILLIVIESTMSIEELKEFINKVIAVRDEITPDSKIYILLHKIDLIKNRKLNDIKYRLDREYNLKNQIQIFYTSIRKRFFLHTFTIFIEILRDCLDKADLPEKLDLSIIQDSIQVVNKINEETVISKIDLQTKLNISDQRINSIIEILSQRDHLEFKDENKKEILALTPNGKNYYHEILKTFSGETIQLKRGYQLEEIPQDKMVPPFVGCFIADKDGKTLFSIEAYSGAFEEHLISGDLPGEENITDIELIPMFISALEKFSQEVNIQDLGGFSLKGSNLKLQIFTYDKFTLTIFNNPNISIKPLEKKIYDFFDALFKNYENEFNKVLRTGEASLLDPVKDEATNWLTDLNKLSEDLILDLNLFDFESAKDLYNKLETISDRINLEFSVAQEKVKKLKVNLMKAILEENYKEVKNVAERTQDLRVKYFM